MHVATLTAAPRAADRGPYPQAAAAAANINGTTHDHNPGGRASEGAFYF